MGPTRPVALAAAAVFAIFYLLALASPRSIGLGDVKLAAVLAGYLAWRGWLTVLDGLAAGFLVAGTGGHIPAGHRSSQALRPPADGSIPHHRRFPRRRDRGMSSTCSRRWVTYKVIAAAVLTVALLTSCASTSHRVTYKVTGPVAPTFVTSISSPASAGSSQSGGRGIGTAAQARVDLAQLPVVDRRPYVPGYQRSCSPGDGCSFGPAWTDDPTSVDGHNGCSIRYDVLAVQLRDVQLREGSRCVVVAGTLHDPYTGATLTFSKSRASLLDPSPAGM